MRIISEMLNEFLIDFNLVSPQGDICFNATIYFSNERRSLQLESEVKIISFNTLDTVYIHLLHADILVHDIPDTFNDKSEKMTYLKNECLIIKGQSVNLEKFVLSIHPQGSHCTEATLTEIHQKTFN